VSLNQLGRCVQLLYTKRSSFDLCIQTYQELTAGPESKLRRLLFQHCITYLPYDNDNAVSPNTGAALPQQILFIFACAILVSERKPSRGISQFLAKIAIQRHRSARISSASLTSVAAAGTVTFRSL